MTSFPAELTEAVRPASCTQVGISSATGRHIVSPYLFNVNLNGKTELFIKLEFQGLHSNFDPIYVIEGNRSKSTMKEQYMRS